MMYISLGSAKWRRNSASAWAPSPGKAKVLRQLVKSGTFTTISDVIRAAIDKFIDIQFSPDYIRKLMIELPKGNVVDLQQLVKSGDSVSVEDAVRNAVREYVRRRL